MDNSVKIRKLMQDIEKEIEKQEKYSTFRLYNLLTKIVICMETKYNLKEEEIINQLELILKSVDKGE